MLSYSSSSPAVPADSVWPSRATLACMLRENTSQSAAAFTKNNCVCTWHTVPDFSGCTSNRFVRRARRDPPLSNRSEGQSCSGSFNAERAHCEKWSNMLASVWTTLKSPEAQTELPIPCIPEGKCMVLCLNELWLFPAFLKAPLEQVDNGQACLPVQQRAGLGEALKSKEELS